MYERVKFLEPMLQFITHLALLHKVKVRQGDVAAGGMDVRLARAALEERESVQAPRGQGGGKGIVVVGLFGGF